MHNVMHSVSLKRQFERRQEDWRPNMHVQEDVELYRIDGVLMGEYGPYPPNPTNGHEMVCFDLKEWERVVHDNESDCATP